MTDPATGRREAEAYWDDLYEQSYAVLFRTAAFVLPSEEAEEVVHEAFERALRADAFPESTREPVAWLRTATARITIDRLRRRRLWERARLLLVPARPAEPAYELRDALRRLPPRQAVALVLRYYQDAPYEEIADALSIHVDSVGPLLSRAKRALREAME